MTLRSGGFLAGWLCVSVVLSTLSCAAAPQSPKPVPVRASVDGNTVRARIVDFGHDFLRDGDGRPVHQFYVHRYRLEKDADTGLYRPVTTGPREVWQEWRDVEVDGDPATPDLIGAMPFSMEEPVSPVAPWYDRLAGTPRWYGGASIWKANADELHITENGVNHEHDGPRHYPRDNWALFHEIYEVDGPYRLCGLWVWKKEDFLNGGSEGRVTFDEGTELALYLQRYFMGVDGVRFVVRDGEQFYISERVFQGAGQVRGANDGKQHVLCPPETRWARYDPREPYHIHFEHLKADFRSHTFDDVTAVGFYAFKDRFIPGYFGFKWYSFEADALVRRPARPGEHLDMVRVPGDVNTPPFYVGKTEVPYELWKNVFRLARSNTFVRNPRGFIFRNDGDMGSMDYPGPDGQLTEHSLQEPVTDVTLHDVAAWCNALSVQESRTPCYYVDPEYREPFHYVIRSPLYHDGADAPPLYVKWDADGYRLPTPGEWQMALGDQDPGLDEEPGATTRPVHAVPANGPGIRGMTGNVWELVWTYGQEIGVQEDDTVTCLGGSFVSPEEPESVSASAYGDSPFDGSFQVGFRVVRREAGLRMPRPRELSEEIPRWDIQRDTKTAARDGAQEPQPDMVDIPDLPLQVAVHETTYAQWKAVRDWAEANGYSFDHDGDMGSMDWWGYADRPVPQNHGPREPVTDISFYDAAAWCNALSEMTGREPVYYADENRTEVYRQAFLYRPLMMLFFEANSADETGAIAYSADRAVDELYMKTNADGYRLPREQEYNAYAGVGRGAGRYSWGDDPVGVFGHAWLFDNSGGTTHPVGRKEPNAPGLHDVEGNVSEMLMGRPPKWDVFGSATCPRAGGSFIDLTVGLRPDKPPFSPSGWGYPDIGFRVVRQVAQEEASGAGGAGSLIGALGMAAMTATAGADDLQIDPAEYDPLQGRVYRGNLRRDGRFEVPGVRELKGLKWRFKTGGPVKSSPVVVDGVAYVGSLDGNVYAVDAETGREVWRFGTGRPVTGSAAVVAGTVYIAGEDGCVYALDARTGERRWSVNLNAYPPHRQNRLAGSPAVAYGVVFVCTGSGGGHDTVYMTNGPTVGLDVRTGEKVWESSWGTQGYGSPAVRGDELFCSNQNWWGAVALAGGRVKWRLQLSGQSRDFVSGVLGEELAYGVGSIGGDIVCGRPGERWRLWQQFTWPHQVAVTTGGELGHEILAAPALAHGLLYVGNNDGKLRTFDAATGKRGWVFETGDRIQSAPSVAGRVLYFGCHDGSLYALDALTGEELWKFSAGEKIVSSPWPTGDAVLFGCDDGYLYAVH